MEELRIPVGEESVSALLIRPAEAKAGWVLLFDGSTMNHWRDPAKENPPGDPAIFQLAGEPDKNERIQADDKQIGQEP